MKPVCRHIENVKAFADACGEIRALSGAEDFQFANMAVAKMRGPSAPHYHNKTTEFYYILGGCGAVRVGAHPLMGVVEGAFVMIPPGLCHYTIPMSTLTILVVSVPAWSAADQILVKNDGVAGYSAVRHLDDLLDELGLRDGRNPRAMGEHFTIPELIEKLTI